MSHKSRATQGILGLGAALLATSAMPIAIDGDAKHGMQAAGRGADVVQLETVVVTASRNGDTAPAIATAGVASPAAARL